MVNVTVMLFIKSRETTMTIIKEIIYVYYNILYLHTYIDKYMYMQIHVSI